MIIILYKYYTMIQTESVTSHLSIFFQCRLQEVTIKISLSLCKLLYIIITVHVVRNHKIMHIYIHVLLKIISQIMALRECRTTSRQAVYTSENSDVLWPDGTQITLKI